MMKFECKPSHFQSNKTARKEIHDQFRISIGLSCTVVSISFFSHSIGVLLKNILIKNNDPVDMKQSSTRCLCLSCLKQTIKSLGT